MEDKIRNEAPGAGPDADKGIEMTDEAMKKVAGGYAGGCCYWISPHMCTKCEICLDACPVDAIISSPYYCIDPSLCLNCGSCEESCPQKAVKHVDA